MKVTVCIGSACHLKGSRLVVEKLQELVQKHEVADQVELAATFCTGNCQKGVCVTVGDEPYSVSPDTAVSFFEEDVLAKLPGQAAPKN